MKPDFSMCKIGVLMGGPSTERDISLKSGNAVYECLKELRLNAVPIDIKTDSPEQNAQLISSYEIDCAFIALHGRFGEDGGIQRVLENMEIVYTGSGSSASKLAMDKIASREVFKTCGLCVPHCCVLEKHCYDGTLPEIPWASVFPLVVKPAAQGSSIGLSIVDTSEELSSAVSRAFTFDNTVIIEEYIAGKEITVGILDSYALPPIEIIPKSRFFDFEAKYHKGITEYLVPAPISADAARLCIRAAFTAHSSIGCSGCSRVDFILDKDDRPFILEINTIPGLTETSLLPKAAEAAGIDFGLLCLRLLGAAYRNVPSAVGVNNH